MWRRSLAVLALLGLALAIWSAWRATRGLEQAPDVGPTERRGAVASGRGAGEGLEPSGAAGRRAFTWGVERDDGGAQAAAGAGAPEGFDPFDYGVLGRVVVLGHPELDFGRGTLTLTDRRGARESVALDPDGAFAMYELAPGAWSVVVEVPGAGVVDTSVLLTEDSPVATLALELPAPGVLDVTVRASASVSETPRARLLPLVLVAHRRPPGTGRERDGLVEVGSASINPHLLSRSHEVSRRMLLPGAVPSFLSLFSNGYRIATRSLEAGRTRVDWELPPSLWPPAPAALRVRTVDAVTRQPIEAFVGAKVGGRWISGEPPARAADGSVVLEGLPVGWLAAVARFEGYADQETWCFLRPGERHDAGDVLVHTGVSISGVVRALEETAPVDLVAWRWDAERGVVEVESYRRAASRAGGRFSFRNLTPGTYLVRSVAPDEFGPSEPTPGHSWVSEFVEVDARASVEDVRVPLRAAGRLVLRPVAPAAEPRGYRIEDARGRWIRTGVLRASTSQSFLLAPGRYWIRVTDGDESAGEWSVAVEAGVEPVVIEY